MESTISKRNEAMLRALAKRASHEANYPIELSREDDLKGLFLNVLQVTGREDKLKNKDEVMKWVEFASTFSPESGSSYPMLEVLNEELTQKSVLLGDGLRTSEADIIVYSAMHSFMNHISNSERQKFPNLMRWLDYVQNKEDFGESLDRLSVEKTEFEPCVKMASEKADINPPSKNTLDLGKNEKFEVKTNQTKEFSGEPPNTDSSASQTPLQMPPHAHIDPLRPTPPTPVDKCKTLKRKIYSSSEISTGFQSLSDAMLARNALVEKHDRMLYEAKLAEKHAQSDEIDRCFRLLRRLPRYDVTNPMYSYAISLFSSETNRQLWLCLEDDAKLAEQWLKNLWDGKTPPI